MSARSAACPGREARACSAGVTEPLTIWLLGDGKPGHENQSDGLAEALARRVECRIFRISLAGTRGLFQRMRRAVSETRALPRPDLIIAAGHATHPSLLRLAHAHGAFSVVLMRPSLPLSWFGLCLAPAHDFPKPRTAPNLILTRGALNRVPPPPSGGKSGRLILLGGPSGTHGWDGPAMLGALREIVAADDGAWTVTDSRRTPGGFLDEVKSALPALHVFPHQETDRDWLPVRLAGAAEVWVSEDSVSMVYEALSSGARVGLLPVPRIKQDARILRGLDQLVAEGFVTDFADWKASGVLAQPPGIPREADRCADLLLHRLGHSMR